MKTFKCTNCGHTKEIFMHTLTPFEVNNCPKCGEHTYIVKETKDD